MVEGILNLMEWYRILVPPPEHLPCTELSADASGSWGCGAWHGLQVQWDVQSRELDISCKELIPIILAYVVWGHSWTGYRVTCHCDNQVVVTCLHSRLSKQAGIMHLLRCLTFIEAHFRFILQPTYINTRRNHLADDISRNRVSSFLSKVPQANRVPTPVSNSLLGLLLNPQVDWIWEHWRRQFLDITRTV